MNQPIKSFEGLAQGLALREHSRSPLIVQDLGQLSITKDRVYYAFPRQGNDVCGLLQFGRKFTYFFDPSGTLRIRPTGNRSGYSVCAHGSNPNMLILQLPRNEEPEFGRWPEPRGQSKVIQLQQSEGWFAVRLDEPAAPPRTAPRTKRTAPAPAPTADQLQGFRERLKAAQDVLNAAKAELGDDMQMRLDADGQLRVVVMLEI